MTVRLRIVRNRTLVRVIGASSRAGRRVIVLRAPSRAGLYQITLTATDAQGRQARDRMALRVRRSSGSSRVTR
jgi:hypothetical protein